MRIFAFCLAFLCLLFPTSCRRTPNYWEYVSENRFAIYRYEDDHCAIELYLGEKERPYLHDGHCAEVVPFSECWAKFDKQPDKVQVQSALFEGEMSYHTSKDRFYLSFGENVWQEDQLALTITLDGKEQQITLHSVKTEGVIDGKTALNILLEYRNDLFTSLTSQHIFLGEIGVRLLYNDGCYYYLGICDRNKKCTAFLIDGATGKIVAEKEL